MTVRISHPPETAKSNAINIVYCRFYSHKGRMSGPTSVVACQTRNICQSVVARSSCYTYVTCWQDAVNWHMSLHFMWLRRRKFLHAQILSREVYLIKSFDKFYDTNIFSKNSYQKTLIKKLRSFTAYISCVIFVF